jgi:protein-S-isoprenylcysteine O-methyltransferase Ste14
MEQQPHMTNPDVAIYFVHAAFWGAFVIARIFVVRRDRKKEYTAGAAPISPKEITAPFSRMLVAFHVFAFGLMYAGIGIAVFPRRVPVWFAGQRIVGAIVIAGGAVLVVSALLSFRSWRFRASVDTHHQLATGGPFRLVRHPIYTGLNLLALGSAIWVPGGVVWIAFLLVAIGGDLRARVEETLLMKAFGTSYREYRSRTRRFVPGIY